MTQITDVDKNRIRKAEADGWSDIARLPGEDWSGVHNSQGMPGRCALPIYKDVQDQSFPIVELPRFWDQRAREEEVAGHQAVQWKITDLHEAVKDEPVYQIPIAFLDLAAHSFDVEGGLISFARHMVHVNEADADHPIILDQWGRILDGRHRLVKALIEGRTTIGAKKVPDGVSATYTKS